MYRFLFFIFIFFVFQSFSFKSDLNKFEVSIVPGDFETSSLYLGDKNILFKLENSGSISTYKELPLDRYNSGVLGFKDGFVEYSIPLIVENIKSVNISFQIFPYEGDFSSFKLFINENYIDNIRFKISNNLSYFSNSILVKVLVNSRGVFINGKRVLQNPIDEILKEDDAYIDFKLKSKDGVIILGKDYGKFKQDIKISVSYKGDKILIPKIIDILNNPIKYADKKVLIKCRYGGWAIFPKDLKIKVEPLPLSLSRSATCVFDDTASIYITRPILVVGHIVSPPFKPRWERLYIYGMVLLDKEGKPYIVNKF